MMYESKVSHLKWSSGDAGSDIHEYGGVRMGKIKRSWLNGWINGITV